jgi:hypothetical protein
MDAGSIIEGIRIGYFVFSNIPPSPSMCAESQLSLLINPRQTLKFAYQQFKEDTDNFFQTERKVLREYFS